MADDLGYGDLSCYGAEKVRTPEIDSLSRQGVLFTDAHSPSAVCTPTRYGVLTGRYCWRTHLKYDCLFGHDPLLIEPDRPTVASLLRSAGYATACVGKWHLGFGKSQPDWNGELKPGPLETGFDYYFGVPVTNAQAPYVYVENHRVVNLDPRDPIRLGPDSKTNVMEGGKAARFKPEELALVQTRKAVDYIERNRDRRFFLYFTPTNVHGPYTPNPRFRGTSECGVYCDSIRELDWSVGEILRTLDKCGLAGNTLVIFTSDNGGLYTRDAYDRGHRCNLDLLGQKTDVWEGGHRVPFLARWPNRIQAGARSDELICLVDFMATAAAVTGVQLPYEAGPDSCNVLPALAREDAAIGPRAKRPSSSRAPRGCWRCARAIGCSSWGAVPAAAPPNTTGTTGCGWRSWGGARQGGPGTAPASRPDSSTTWPAIAARPSTCIRTTRRSCGGCRTFW